MNAAHLHLIMNHAPVFGVAFALVLLAVGRYRRSEDLTRAGLLTLVASAAAALAAMLTGDAAEDPVERLAGVSKAAIHAHEEAAELAAIVTYVAGALALGALGLRRRAARVAGRLSALAAVAAVAAFVLMARAANLGGQIRHAEITGAAMADAGSRPAPSAAVMGRDGGKRD
jgi:uncharacterized membrane protein